MSKQLPTITIASEAQGVVDRAKSELTREASILEKHLLGWKNNPTRHDEYEWLSTVVGNGHNAGTAKYVWNKLIEKKKELTLF